MKKIALILFALTLTAISMMGCPTFDEDIITTPNLSNSDDDDIAISYPTARPVATARPASVTATPTPVVVYVIVTATPEEEAAE